MCVKSWFAELERLEARTSDTKRDGALGALVVPCSNPS